MGEKAIARLLEDSEGLSTEDFAVKLCDIEYEFGIVLVKEEKDDRMEVSQGEDMAESGEVERLQVKGEKSQPKPRPLTKARAITINSVRLDEDKDNNSMDSEVTEVCPHPSKARSKLSGGLKHGEVEVKMEQVRGGGGCKVCCKWS